MMRTYIVTYDICDNKRLQKVFQCLRRWGDHIQYSVFRCCLSLREKYRLEAELSELIHHGEDQVLFIDLGLVESLGRDPIEYLGRPYSRPERHALVF